tara:strand:- start:140 stop:817 length:678 start_codon:yes stop_codon:yes gene_type:complete
MATKEKTTKEILSDTASTIRDFDLVPAPAKAFINDVVFNSLLPGRLQNKMTFTKDFFDPTDIAYIKEKLMAQIKKTGKTSGNVDYENEWFYPSGTTSAERKGGSIRRIFTEPEERVLKSLGRFGYSYVDGEINITDQFNFNDAKADRQNIPLSEKFKTIGSDIDKDATIPNSEGKIEPLSNYGKIRKVAQHLGSSEGSGATFKLKIPVDKTPTVKELIKDGMKYD